MRRNLLLLAIACCLAACNQDEDVQPNSGNGGGDSQDNNPEWVKMSGPSDRTIIDVIELFLVFLGCYTYY